MVCYVVPSSLLTLHHCSSPENQNTSDQALRTATPKLTSRALFSRPTRTTTTALASSATTPNTTLRSLPQQRHLTTTSSAKMPQMPKNIITGGKDDLKLSDPSLLQQAAHIDGQWVKAAKNGKTLEVHNKATHALIGTVPDMGAAETKDAINAAHAAWPAWKAKTGKERGDLLFKLYDALTANADDLAKIIVGENGKSLTEAKGEVAYSNSFIQWFAGEAQRIYGHTAPAPMPGVRNVVLKQPVGVAGLITPWNFPAAMITRKVGPALAAGCTCVVKAPAETPFSAMALAHLAEKVGIPKGVINVITSAKGENEAAMGKELCENSLVKKISFTGSTRVGKILMSQSANTLKKLSMELGGNAPFVVFDDADLDKAVDGAIACKFRASGQTCVCANRIYVHASIYDEFSKKLAAKVDQFKVGHGLHEGTTHGPLVNQAGLEKVENHVNESVKGGAKVLIGGKRGEGTFFEPTILTDLPDHPPTDFEETFGPLASLYKFSSEDEVIAKCNDVPVGLGGYFYSREISRVWRVAEALQVGMVGVNTGILSQCTVPFGGVKESGFGREGGKDGIQEYLVDKLIVFGS